MMPRMRCSKGALSRSRALTGSASHLVITLPGQAQDPQRHRDRHPDPGGFSGAGRGHPLNERKTIFPAGSPGTDTQPLGAGPRSPARMLPRSTRPWSSCVPTMCAAPPGPVATMPARVQPAVVAHDDSTDQVAASSPTCRCVRWALPVASALRPLPASRTGPRGLDSTRCRRSLAP